MKTTIEERKEKAIEIMKKLNIYEPYIEGFKQNNEVCYFERFAGFWTWQDKELQTKIDEIQNKYNCTVYAVTHEITEFGELYDFLIVSEYKEEWETTLDELDKNCYYAYAYVWNKDDDYLSEFGDIEISSFGGGIRRIV